jgi:hypothetical protein
MQSKKRVNLQQFDVIYLPNPDLIYIRIIERNKMMFVPFHLLKTYIRNPFSILYLFFSPSHVPGNDDATTIRGEVSFAKFLFLTSWFVKLSETNFSFFPKLDYIDVKLICQIVRVGLIDYSRVLSVPHSDLSFSLQEQCTMPKA